MSRTTTVLLDGLNFPEGPRWRDGKLWFSDMHGDRVMTVDAAGSAHTVCDVPGQPSGLGWTPDGTLLVVSMTDRRLLRLDEGGLSEVADLSALASGHCNDMVVDAAGRAYVGNFGFDMFGDDPTPKHAELIMVDLDGTARVVAGELIFPNGMVIFPDNRTLVVGETMGARLTAFTIQDDGSLVDRRIWAEFEDTSAAGAVPVAPDGCCLDAEGAIWVASPMTGEVLRVHEGGRISERFKPDTLPFACMLGGADGRTLFVATAESYLPDECRARATGRIEVVEVDVPGAGLP